MTNPNQSDAEKTFSQPPLPVLRRLISGLRLFPKTHDFFSYFERHSQNTLCSARLLCTMIADKADRPEFLKQLKEYEHIGDKITHEVVDLVRATFLTPLDRTDIHKLIVKMDDILDIIYYIGNRLTRYNVSNYPQEMVTLADIVLRSSEELSKAVAGLSNMKNCQKVLNHCVEVNRLENEADEVVNVVIEKLFTKGWDPIEIIKLKELVEHLEAAVDKCEDVANIIEGIILKSA